MIYTGIGSRQTPQDILNLMERIANYLGQKDWTLRSGGADGADSAFERGHRGLGEAQIYLPWKKFNKNDSPLYGVCDEALKIASEIHPAWANCSDAAKRLHARNCYQILGKDLKSPSDLVICWTLDGKIAGGTATAIKLAQQYNVPVINLAVHSKEDLWDTLKSIANKKD